MLLSCSEHSRKLAVGLAVLALPVLGAASHLRAQEARAASATQPVVAQEIRRIISSEIHVSRGESRLELEMEGGQHFVFSVRQGQAYAGDEAIGAVARGSELDRSWRDLLNRAIQASSDELGPILAAWQPPEETELDHRLEAALGGRLEPALAIPQAPRPPRANRVEDFEIELSDSVERLVERIEELQEEVERVEIDEDLPIAIRLREEHGSWWSRGPLRHVFSGLGGLLKAAILYGILFAIAFATIFFGGRRFIEGVADTARAATGRSLLVGLAASFLVIPVFILGILALAISIVGIPALLAWVPLFPVAVGLALMLGYIGVAHGAGEALAERRFYLTDWFQRGNSYYFLITGLGLLLAPFIVMNVVRMAGPWLGFLYGICVAVGVIGTWAALSIGLGAVLISRAGTRPLRPTPSAEPEIYAEPTSA